MANEKNTGRGRPKGAKNKISVELKDLIMGAALQAGGQDYLAAKALENPVAVMSLLSKLLPKAVNVAGDAAAPIEIKVKWQSPE